MLPSSCPCLLIEPGISQHLSRCTWLLVGVDTRPHSLTCSLMTRIRVNIVDFKGTIGGGVSELQVNFGAMGKLHLSLDLDSAKLLIRCWKACAYDFIQP
jgi:hypothetical protein